MTLLCGFIWVIIKRTIMQGYYPKIFSLDQSDSVTHPCSIRIQDLLGLVSAYYSKHLHLYLVEFTWSTTLSARFFVGQQLDLF